MLREREVVALYGNSVLGGHFVLAQSHMLAPRGIPGQGLLGHSGARTVGRCACVGIATFWCVSGDCDCIINLFSIFVRYLSKVSFILRDFLGAWLVTVTGKFKPIYRYLCVLKVRLY